MGPLGFATGTEWLPRPLGSPAVNVGQRPAPSVPEEGGRGIMNTAGAAPPPALGRPLLLLEPRHLHR